MKSQSAQIRTPLTETMIDECPAIDIHVHAQGTISPQTAWELGLCNKLITVSQQADGTWQLQDGPLHIGKGDPAKRYSNIFCSRGGFEISLDENGAPIDLAYNYNCVGDGHDKFTGFDAVMATVQGHRHPPGGLQTEEDYRFIMERYLQSCVRQNVRYTEALQNIHIAHVLRPDLPPKEARAQFFRLCRDIVKQFAQQNVHLRFHHCPNKTSKSNLPGALAERSLEWPEWLKEANSIAPNVFVALNSAGHEEQERLDGGPFAMKKAYENAKNAGFGCEAHAGEGIGVEHMLDTMQCLPVTRIAHGVQVIESQAAINEVLGRGITLIMMPYINVTLGAPLHVKETTQGEIPHAKMQDGMRDPSVHTKHILDLTKHPIFTLMRDHSVPIALATDNPEMGGMTYKEQVKLLAGFGSNFPSGFLPLSAEELALCNMHALKAAFCSRGVKEELAQALLSWMTKYNIKIGLSI